LINPFYLKKLKFEISFFNIKINIKKWMNVVMKMGRFTK
jgi:hypothetical protein